MDLVQFAISPGVLPDMKIKAEEQVIAKLPQLPLGQKLPWRGALRRALPARCWPRGTRRWSRRRLAIRI